MKKIAFLVIISIFLTGCTLPFKLNQIQSPVKRAETKPATASSSNDQSQAVPPEVSEKLFKVTRVIDGDTIELENGKKLRLIGIDAPESIECYFLKSTEKLKSLVLNKLVNLEKDVSETDRYGRLLRYVYQNGNFINESLVKEGFASSYTYPPDVKYQDKILKAQSLAKEKNVGLWKECRKSQGEVQGAKQVKTVAEENKLAPSLAPIPTPAPEPTPEPATAPNAAPVSPPTPSPPPVTSHIYYTSSYKTSKFYYCDTDSGWKSLSATNLRSFNSVEALLKEFPTRAPHRDPLC